MVMVPPTVPLPVTLMMGDTMIPGVPGGTSPGWTLTVPLGFLPTTITTTVPLGLVMITVLLLLGDVLVLVLVLVLVKVEKTDVDAVGMVAGHTMTPLTLELPVAPHTHGKVGPQALPLVWMEPPVEHWTVPTTRSLGLSSRTEARSRTLMAMAGEINWVPWPTSMELLLREIRGMPEVSPAEETTVRSRMTTERTEGRPQVTLVSWALR